MKLSGGPDGGLATALTHLDPLPRKPKSSFLRFPAIQGIKGEEKRADLAP
jgi:hypothetical protein